MKKTLFLICIVPLLISCATTYQPNQNGTGYEDVALAEDRFAITFTSNTKNDFTAVKDLALRRAAEVTINQGYEYFTVTKEEQKQTSTGCSCKTPTPIKRNVVFSVSAGLAIVNFF